MSNNEQKNEEIVVVENASQTVEVYNTNYQRVNFDDPTTILNYGGEIKDEMSEILNVSSDFVTGTTGTELDETKFEELVNFDAELLEEQEEQKKENQQPGLVKSVKKGLRTLAVKVGLKKEEEDNRGYEARFQRYCEKIEELVRDVEQLQENEATAFGLRQTFIQTMTPKVKELEMMIEVGEQDRATYDEETANLRLQLPTDTTGDIAYSVQIREQMSAVFDKKLVDLRNAAATYKKQIQDYRMQQTSSLQICIDYSNFIKDAAPILKAQGSIKVFNIEQQEHLKRIQTAKAITNKVLVQNAEETLSNLTTAMNEAKEGYINSSTLQVLAESSKKGVDVITKGRQELAKKIELDKKTLAAINASQEESQNAIIALIGDNLDLKESFGTIQATRPALVEAPKIKKIGKRK